MIVPLAQLKEVSPEPTPLSEIMSQVDPELQPLLPTDCSNTRFTDIRESDIDNNNNNNDNDTNDLIDSYFPLHPVSTSTYHELYYLIKNAFPVFLTFFIQYLIQILIPTYFASKLGSIELSACTLSITTFYLTGPVIVNGFASALDTLCSTAYGARHYHKVGLYYIQCTIILSICLIPSCLFWFNSYSFFKYITSLSNSNSNNIDDNIELAKLCHSFLKTFSFITPAIVIFESTKRFLQSQCKFSIPTRIVIIGIPISFSLNLYLSKNPDVFSFISNNSSLIEPIQIPAISFAITYWIMTICLVSYMYFIDGYQCLPSFEYLKSKHFKSYISSSFIFFKLGLPGILMILSEALAFQVITFMSTTFSKDQLAAQSIVSTLASLAFQPPYAIGICCSTHIANLIGARSSNYKPAMKAIYILMISLSIFNFTWFFLLRVKLASLFTNDEKILEIVSKLAIIIAINQFLDCFNILCAAILRGQGRQQIGSILSILSYYIIGVPLEILLGFHFNLQVYGLWIGLALGVNFLSIVELYIVYRSNWMSIIKRNNKLT